VTGPRSLVKNGREEQVISIEESENLLNLSSQQGGKKKNVTCHWKGRVAKKTSPGENTDCTTNSHEEGISKLRRTKTVEDSKGRLAYEGREGKGENITGRTWGRKKPKVSIKGGNFASYSTPVQGKESILGE